MLITTSLGAGLGTPFVFTEQLHQVHSQSEETTSFCRNILMNGTCIIINPRTDSLTHSHTHTHTHTHSLCLTISLYSSSDGHMYASLQYISLPCPRWRSNSCPKRRRRRRREEELLWRRRCLTGEDLHGLRMVQSEGVFHG